MYFVSVLYWYKILFTLELIVSESLFVYKFRRRDKFLLRAVSGISVLLLAAFAMPVVAFDAAWTSFMFLFLFACTQCVVKFCFDENWWNIVFCGIVAYTVQHMAYTVSSAAGDIVVGLLDMPFSVDPYSSGSPAGGGIEIFISLLVYVVSYFVVYWICYYVCGDRIHPNEDLRIGRTHLIVSAWIVVLVDIVFNLVTVYNDAVDGLSRWLMRFYDMLVCIVALILQFTRLDHKEVKTELAETKRLMREQQRQYELTKQSIDMINIKSHDLKYHIRALMRSGGRFDEREMSDIEQALQIYQSVVKTGNEAVDTILTEKSLFCESNHISLTCVIDGAQLDFMRDVDIYSLFGNALDNAIEAVKDVGEEKRNIGISVKRVGEMVSVHVENYLDKPLEMNGDLPRTTKKDKEFHGFGLISIRNIVQKYGGIMTVKTVKNTFNLNIIFPRSPQDIPQKRPIVPQEDKLKD